MSEPSGPDPLVRLAREAIEAYVRDRTVIKAPLMPDVEPRQAGVFVCLHSKDSSLRGCIGTYLPSRRTIEIRSTGLSRPRQSFTISGLMGNSVAAPAESVSCKSPSR